MRGFEEIAGGENPEAPEGLVTNELLIVHG